MSRSNPNGKVPVEVMKKMELMQNYIEALEDKLRLLNYLPPEIKRLMNENAILKSSKHQHRKCENDESKAESCQLQEKAIKPKCSDTCAQEKNEILKAEIQKLKNQNFQYSQEIAFIKTKYVDTPASDLRRMINACKLRDVENIGELALFLQVMSC